MNPAMAVISVEADNRLGHPCEEVLERLELALSEVEGGLPSAAPTSRGR